MIFFTNDCHHSIPVQDSPDNFNCDETGFSCSPGTKKVFCSRKDNHVAVILSNNEHLQYTVQERVQVMFIPAREYYYFYLYRYVTMRMAYICLCMSYTRLKIYIRYGVKEVRRFEFVFVKHTKSIKGP
jgi:hypothetical protein